MTIDDLCHCQACGTPFLEGDVDGYHCSPDCAALTRRREIRKERRALVAQHGPESVAVAEFDQEYQTLTTSTED